MKAMILSALFLSSCVDPTIYECAGWDKRECICPSGEVGNQRCSRGSPFNDPDPPRSWGFCSCCFTTHRDEWGIYLYETNSNSGCWDDIYNPVTAYDTGGEE